MKNFFTNLNVKMQQWMVGRYGYDELSRVVSITAMIFLILSCFQNLRFLCIPALVLWVLTVVRCYSRNIGKRRSEQASYLRFTGRFRSRCNVSKKAWQERKTHRYYNCRQCGTVLRVPKGKGKIKITCPSCHTETIRKT